MSVIGDLYENEINVHISSFWDCGFLVKLGDAVNGYSAGAVVDSWDDVERWIVAKTVEQYPDSSFARFYGPRLRKYQLDMGHVRDLPASDLANVEDPLATVDWDIPGAPPRR
jgi:hypothetical protein